MFAMYHYILKPFCKEMLILLYLSHPCNFCFSYSPLCLRQTGDPSRVSPAFASKWPKLAQAAPWPREGKKWLEDDDDSFILIIPPQNKKKAICFGSCQGNSSPTVTMHFWLSDSVSLNLHLLEQVQTRLPRLFVKCLRCGKREMWPNREKMKAKKRRRRNSFLIFKLYYID